MRNRILVALAFAAALGAGTASPGGAAPTCSASQLRGSLYGENGAAGTIMLSVTLRNTGARCSMKGYTGLRLENGHKLLPTHVVHGALPLLARKPQLVLLAQGGYATVLIAYSDVPHGNDGRCPSSNALLVRPPGQSVWLRVKVSAVACAHGTLDESPVLLGRRHAP